MAIDDFELSFVDQMLLFEMITKFPQYIQEQIQQY